MSGETVREADVPAAIGRIENNVELLEKTVADFVDRLDRVVRAWDETKEPQEQPPKSTTPMGDQLLGINARIGAAIAKLQNILDRLEI